MPDDQAQQAMVTGIVVRGFITRFAREESWEEALVEMPEGYVPRDPDAVPHYRRGPDGRFYESYGRTAATKEAPIYLVDSDAEPSQ